jgi:hypothetical protein
MQDKPTPSFSNFMRDTDGEYSRAMMLKAARALIAEGRRPDRVYRAMVLAAYDLAAEHDDDGRFLRATGEWATGLFNDLSKELARLEAEREQAR